MSVSFFLRNEQQVSISLYDGAGRMVRQLDTQHRIPGQQFVLWALFLVVMQILRVTEAPTSVAAPIAISYIAFCIYTWIAPRLGKIWTKIVPPK